MTYFLIEKILKTHVTIYVDFVENKLQKQEDISTVVMNVTIYAKKQYLGVMQEWPHGNEMVENAPSVRNL